MNLQVKDIVEHEDGSATVTFDFDDETMKALIEYAILDIFTKTVAQYKQE